MPYVPLDTTKPNIAQVREANIGSARTNLQALRDIYMATGTFPGFDLYVVSGGAIPGANPEKPETVYFARPPEYVRVDFNWNAANNVTVMVFYFTPDGGASWLPMVDAAGNYIVRITYDANDAVTAITWGAALLADEEARTGVNFGANL